MEEATKVAKVGPRAWKSFELRLIEDQVLKYPDRLAPDGSVTELMNAVNKLNEEHGTGIQRSFSSINSILWIKRMELKGAPVKRTTQLWALGKSKGDAKLPKPSASNVVISRIAEIVKPLIDENRFMKEELRKLRAVRDAVETYQKGLR